MKIQILGMGCQKCRETAARVERVVRDLGISAKIEKVEDVREIGTFGVIATPAVAVDGRVRISGKVPTTEEIAAALTDARRP